MKLSLIMNSDTLICLWILVFRIGIIEVSISRKWCFWLYVSSLHDYWPPRTWNSLVNTSWGKMERCEKRAFQRNKEINWNIKTKCVTDFLNFGLHACWIILVITLWVHKRQTFTLISIKIMRIWEFFVYN